MPERDVVRDRRAERTDAAGYGRGRRARARRGAWPSWPVFAEDDRRAAVDQVLASGEVELLDREPSRQLEFAFARRARMQHAITLADGHRCDGTGVADAGCRCGSMT